MNADVASAPPWGFDVYVTTHTDVRPKPAPLRWLIGPLGPKLTRPLPGSRRGPTPESEITVQLTADQQCRLSMTGTDRYGNPVDPETTGTTWASSDEGIVQLVDVKADSCTAVAVGPVGNAVVSVTADANADQVPDFTGAVALQVVAGMMTDVEVTASEAEDKPVVEPRRDR